MTEKGRNAWQMRPARGDRNASRLYPERRPRGDKHPLCLRPELATRGENCSWAKLTEDQVREIRARAASETQTALARCYGISQGTVWRIVNRLIWKHVA